MIFYIGFYFISRVFVFKHIAVAQKAENLKHLNTQLFLSRLNVRAVKRNVKNVRKRLFKITIFKKIRVFGQIVFYQLLGNRSVKADKIFVPSVFLLRIIFVAAVFAQKIYRPFWGEAPDR